MAKKTKVIEVAGIYCPFSDDMGNCLFDVNLGCCSNALDLPIDGCPLQEHDQIIIKLKK